MADFNFEVVEDLGVIGQRGSRELHLAVVSWNDRKPKLELRTWDEEMTTPGKGVTLSEDEAELLMNMLKDKFEG